MLQRKNTKFKNLVFSFPGVYYRHMETSSAYQEVHSGRVENDLEKKKDALAIVDKRIREILSEMQVSTFTKDGRTYEIKTEQERTVANAQAMLGACSKVLAEIRNKNESSKEHYLLEKTAARLEGRLRLHEETVKYDVSLLPHESKAVNDILSSATKQNVRAANDDKYLVVDKAA